MEAKSPVFLVGEYLRANWFKAAVVFLIMTAFIKKEFSFNIQMAQPGDKTEELREQERPRPKKKEELSDRPEAKQASLLDRFELPFFSKSEKVTTYRKDLELKDLDEATKKAFVKRFSHVAKSETKKYGIPASIILANAMLHSAAGQRELTKRSNNFFLIPCTNEWSGEETMHNGKCYREYESAWISFRNHSIYLTEGDFAYLQKYGKRDFKSWAYGMEKLKFSSKGLASQLIELIEDYDLDQFD